VVRHARAQTAMQNATILANDARSRCAMFPVPFTGRINKITIELKKMSAANEATEKKAAGESNEVEENQD
jgi:hypothetical protein